MDAARTTEMGKPRVTVMGMQEAWRGPREDEKARFDVLKQTWSW